MNERLPIGEYEEFPTFEIDTPTAFALYEYMLDNNVGLVQAVNQMVDIGWFVVEAEMAGISFEVEYLLGEGPYRADDEIFDAIKEVKRVKTGLHIEYQRVLAAVADALDKKKDDVFVMFVEKARTLRLHHKKNAIITMVAPDGSREQIQYVP